MSVDMIPVVVAFTPGYFIPASTCLFSAFDCLEQGEKLHVICLLSEELPQRMKQKIRLIGNGRSRYTFINLRGRLRDIYVDAKYTEAASYRLLLPDLLPEYEKVIYMDCDLIVRNDLAVLYRTVNLGENYLAAVFEAPLDFQAEHIKKIGCEPMKYINSGFLIMNLKLMRNDRMVEKFLEASKAGYLEFPDQDVLNRLCKDRILGLSPCYNGIRTFYLPQYKKDFLHKYSEQDWKEVQEHGNVHYTGAKPWQHFTIEFKLWWQYYDRLPETVKNEWKADKRLYRLYRFNQTTCGAWLVDRFQNLYRKLKYRKTGI